jgi:hypothetical protein
MHPYHHALSSAKKFGGEWQDYLFIHNWFDETKALMGDARHRALRHHTAGIFWCEQEFGTNIKVGDKLVPVRLVAEQHVMEDMGFLPTPEWWLSNMKLTIGMNRVPSKPPVSGDEWADTRKNLLKDIYGLHKEIPSIRECPEPPPS